MANESCKTCRFFRPDRRPISSHGSGECRRYPPQQNLRLILADVIQATENVRSGRGIASFRDDPERMYFVQICEEEIGTNVLFPQIDFEHDAYWCGEYQPSPPASQPAPQAS